MIRIVFFYGARIFPHGIHRGNNSDFFFGSIEYLDDVAFQSFTQYDNRVGFPYTVAKEESFPVTHERSFHPFLGVEVGNEIGNEKDNFLLIKKRGVRMSKKHTIKILFGDFSREKYLFEETPDFFRGFYDSKTGRFRMELTEIRFTEKKHIFIFVFILLQIRYEFFYVLSHISVGRSVSTAIYTDSHEKKVMVKNFIETSPHFPR